jgi:hypothetical protein
MACIPQPLLLVRENMNQIKPQDQGLFRELNAEEISIISGGARYECTIKIDSKGNKSIECKISGTFGR